MIFDRELPDHLREKAHLPTTAIGPKVTYRRAAKEIELRDAVLEVLGDHFEESNDIDKFLLTLEPADAEMVCDYYGWTQHFGTDEVFAEDDEDDQEETD